MSILKAGALYFALVFAAGFTLAPIRLFWLMPRAGERMAELMETPIMLALFAPGVATAGGLLDIPMA